MVGFPLIIEKRATHTNNKLKYLQYLPETNHSDQNLPRFKRVNKLAIATNVSEFTTVAVIQPKRRSFNQLRKF